MTGEISSAEFLTKRFPTEQSAVDFFASKRWNGKIACPYCGSVKVYVSQKEGSRQPYKCGDCNHKFTVKTGTIMEGSKVEVRIWLFAMHKMGTARKGISSIQLAKELGVTQKTAWYMAHRIREACRETGMLKEETYVDEMYHGGKEKNKHASKRLHSGRGVANKTPIVGIRDRSGKTIARVVKDTSAETLQGFIAAHIEPGAAVYTDEHRAYTGLNRLGYRHELVNHSAGEYVRGDVGTNSIESFWALVRRGIYGTYHSLSAEHLQRYVDEFAYRLSNGGTLAFIDAVCTHANGNMLRYRELCATRSK